MSPYARAFAILCVLVMPATAWAQRIDRPQLPSAATLEGAREPLLQQAVRLSAPLEVSRVAGQRAGEGHAPSPRGRRTPAKRIFGAIVGGTGGFFAGAYTGAWIEGDRCHCDDPGLKGAVIGGPIGAAAGGVLGALFLF